MDKEHKNQSGAPVTPIDVAAALALCEEVPATEADSAELWRRVDSQLDHDDDCPAYANQEAACECNYVRAMAALDQLSRLAARLAPATRPNEVHDLIADAILHLDQHFAAKGAGGGDCNCVREGLKQALDLAARLSPSPVAPPPDADVEAVRTLLRFIWREGSTGESVKAEQALDALSRLAARLAPAPSAPPAPTDDVAVLTAAVVEAARDFELTREIGVERRPSARSTRHPTRE
jgi:hypothetical protein